MGGAICRRDKGESHVSLNKALFLECECSIEAHLVVARMPCKPTAAKWHKERHGVVAGSRAASWTSTSLPFWKEMDQWRAISAILNLGAANAKVAMP